MNEIRTETYNEKTPFKRWNINRKAATEYSKDPKFRIGGKDVSIKETQNQAARDCNIYDVIETYRGDLKMTAAQLNQFHTELDQELAEIKTLPDAMKAIQKGEEAWKTLPMDIRKQFGNSINRFLQEGPTYFKEQIKTYNAKIQQQKDFLKNYEEIQKAKETEMKNLQINKGTIENG